MTSLSIAVTGIIFIKQSFPFEVRCQGQESLVAILVSCKGIFLHDAAADEVFLNDALQDLRGAGVIPNGFRVNYGDGTFGADAEAVGFGAEYFGFGTNEVQFLQTLLEVFPRFIPFLAGTALGFALIGAEENVAMIFFQAKFFGCFFEAAQVITPFISLGPA